jgi:hypothetical protein
MRTSNAPGYTNSALPNQHLLELALNVNDVLARAQERIVRQQALIVETLLEVGVEECQALGDARGVSDLLSWQVEVMANFGEKMITVVQEMVDIQLHVCDEFIECLGESLETMSLTGALGPHSKKAA